MASFLDSWCIVIVYNFFAKCQRISAKCREISLHCLKSSAVMQWRSQALKSGWAGGLRTEVPAGSRGGPQWGSGGEGLRSQIYTVCSCQMLFDADLLPSPSFKKIPTYRSKNSLVLCESHDPTWPGHGGHIGGHVRYCSDANYTVSQKNDTDVTHYRFNPHQPISVIFGRDVAERVCY